MLIRENGLFVRDTSGSVAILFAFSALLLIMFAGVALDFSGASSRKTKLQGSTDSALLAGAKVYRLNSGNGVGIPANVKKEILDVLAANMSSASLVGDITISQDGALCGTTTTVYDTQIMSIFGFNRIPIKTSGCVQAEIVNYIDFYIVMDNTPSMGLGATTADMNNLRLATLKSRGDALQGCAFACHVTNQPPGPYNAGHRSLELAQLGYDMTPVASRYSADTLIPESVWQQYMQNPSAFAATNGLRKLPKITLRIDVVQKAVENLFTTARAKQRITDQYRFAVYSFGPSCNNGSQLTEVPGLRTPVGVDQAESLLRANPVKLQYLTDNKTYQEQCTEFQRVFGSLNQGYSKIPNSGNGSRQNPKVFVFFVSDGFNDSQTSQMTGGCLATDQRGTYYGITDTFSAPSRCLAPINVEKTCAPLKASPRNINIASLYTTYLPMDDPNSPNYNGYYHWVNAQIHLNDGPYIPSTNSMLRRFMESCASPGYFFEVGPDQGIDEAMRALFLKAISDKLYVSQ